MLNFVLYCILTIRKHLAVPIKEHRVYSFVTQYPWQTFQE